MDNKNLKGQLIVEEKFIRYQSERDVLFVFGAGASISDGGPLQKDLLPEILNEDYGDSELANLVKKFISTNFDTENGNYPSLESVFGYLDYFISKKESLKGGYTTIQLISIKESLIRLIHHRISETKTRKGIYKKFLECLDKVNKNVSIITMNYDTLLDESFDFLYGFTWHHFNNANANNCEGSRQIFRKTRDATDFDPCCRLDLESRHNRPRKHRNHFRIDTIIF